MIAPSLAPTPTELAADRRRRAFRKSIERKATELASSKLGRAMIAERLPAPDPAAVVAVESAAGDMQPAPANKHWFSILGLLPHTVTILHVMEAVCREFEIEPREIAGDRRMAKFVLPRQIAMWLCKELIPGKSLPAIGRKFGGKDHTTVLHACRVAPVKVARDPDLPARVARIRQELSTFEPSPHVSELASA